ncbi:myb-like protein X isoform X1 [Centruroides vittatus]|uniref:myb-like protein X isoform X1 n=1 Tax=Centruroides vittatus TaxID=120091 RepID=UPI00350EBE10
MKTENVQRQNLIELKKERCLEIKRTQVEPIIEKSSKKESQTARKSTNPTKLIRSQEIKIGSPHCSKEEEQGSSAYFDTLEPPQISMSVPAENEKLDEEQNISEELPILEKEETSCDNVENEDKDIEKVWENIRKDLTFSEEENNNEIKENDDNEFLNASPEEKIAGPEEEEPSDWEDHEPSDGEIENEKQQTTNETVESGECVLILSDEEIEETIQPLKVKELDNQSVEVSNENLANTSKEDELETVMIPDDKSNIEVEESLNSTDHQDEKAVEKEETKEAENTENNNHVDYKSDQEFKDQELIESDLETDNENNHMKDVTDTVEYLSEKSTKMSNSDSDNINTRDSTKITIKRSVSSGNEEYELKKMKLDNDSYDQLNCNENNLYAVENGASDECEADLSSNISRSKSTILTQKALEDMIAQEICEYMMEGNKNCIMTWKKKNQELESIIDTWKKKAESLQQQLLELQVEQKKLQSLGNRAPGIPFKKATRTVGINVRLPQELLTRTVGTNVNLPQRPIERLPKCISPSKSVSKISSRSDSSSSQGTSAVTNQEKIGTPPVPMQLIANTAMGPSKSVPSTVSSTTIKPVASSISVIDLTREDGDVASSSSNNNLSTASSLASLSGGSVVVTSPPKTITLSSTPTQNNPNVVAVPLVCTTSLPSMMPFIPSAPTGVSTSIRTSQSSAAVVPSNLNQGARVTYLVPQVTGSSSPSKSRTPRNNKSEYCCQLQTTTNANNISTYELTIHPNK